MRQGINAAMDAGFGGLVQKVSQIPMQLAAAAINNEFEPALKQLKQQYITDWKITFGEAIPLTVIMAMLGYMLYNETPDVLGSILKKIPPGIVTVQDDSDKVKVLKTTIGQSLVVQTAILIMVLLLGVQRNQLDQTWAQLNQQFITDWQTTFGVVWTGAFILALPLNTCVVLAKEKYEPKIFDCISSMFRRGGQVGDIDQTNLLEENKRREGEVCNPGETSTQSAAVEQPNLAVNARI